MVHHFNHRDGVLFAEDVNLNDLAREVGTPFYVYSSATLRRHVRVVREAFDGLDLLMAYAMKANSNQAVLKLMASEGCGADVVSLGELERALAAGIAPEKIVFSGVAKTVAEMRRGLEAGIKCFNVESEPELERLSMVAADMGKTARVSVRVNPDVDARTHAKISTSPISGPARSMPASPPCPMSRPWASICISGRRSPISNPSATPLG
jgi:diaminopimelate decarboxylase